MTAGIAIYNDSGTVQIDENFRNLFVKASGLGSSGDPTAFYGITYPLCAIQCADLAIAKVLHTIPNGALHSDTGQYFVYREGTAPFKWWVMELLVAPVSNYGLHVFNAAGELVFDALQKPIRIVDYQVFNTVAAWLGTSWTYAAGRQYAVIFGKYASRFITEYLDKNTEDGEGRWDIQKTVLYAGAKVVDNVVTLGWVTARDEVILDYGPVANLTKDYPRLEMIVIDVTGY